MITSAGFKRIKIKYSYVRHTELFKEDCNRIHGILLDHGYFSTLDECAELWELYSSEEYAAGWLSLPDKNEEVYECIKPYFEEV